MDRCATLYFEKETPFMGLRLSSILLNRATPQEVVFLFDEAVRGYLESAQKNKLPISVLNQDVASEYELLWNAGQKGYKKGRQHIYSTSSQSISALVA